MIDASPLTDTKQIYCITRKVITVIHQAISLNYLKQ